MAKDHVMFGFASVTVDATSTQQCIQQCVYSMQLYNIVCRAGVMFTGPEKKQNCILTVESRSTQPAAYAAMPGSDYFEPQCANDPPAQAAKTRSVNG
jgi:hypothetical protein